MTPIERELAARDATLREAVAAVRRHWRWRVLLEGAAVVGVTLLGALLLGAVLSALLGPGSSTATVVRVVGYLLIGAAAARFLVRPLWRRVGDEQIALYVEEQAPELRQTLLSAVHEMGRPRGEGSSPALTARLMDRAIEAVERLERGATLERPRVRRAAGGLGLAVAAGALLTVFGPAILRDVARVLFIPWSEAAAAPVLAVGVSPGHAAVPRGSALDIRAELHGFSAPAAELVMRADSADTDWIRVPMLRDSTGAGFTVRLFDLVQNTDYFVESEGVTSATFRLTITHLPAVRQVGLELRFPAHTGLPPESIPDGGDVAAVSGTTVLVRAAVTMPVQGGSLRFDDGTTVPLTVGEDGRVGGSFRLTRDGWYRVDLSAPDGTLVPGTVHYTMESLDDQPPIVRIDEPGRDTKVTAVEEVTVSVRVADDFGVSGLELRYAVNGGEERRIVLAEGTSRGTTDLRAAHTFFLEEWPLAPGDLVAYHAVATDGAGNTASSDIYFLEIRPFNRNYRQAEQGGGGGGGGGGESVEGLSARQREIVAGTFNWVRDSARTGERERRENLTTLAIMQGRLKEEVATLSRRMAERNVARVDSLFTIIQAELDTAVRDMQQAEEALGLGRAEAALPAEQRALQRVQRAEAAYRDVQVQMGGGGGGGGGGGSSSAEDLADLFELETDRVRNQYESVQRESSNAAQQELDETRERLRQLAARQQQENERMQRMAEALRDRLGRESGSGGGGGAQRDLAREAEEDARRLERLARERNSPALAEAARQLQQAAEAMRRAASGNAAQGNAALERLQRASQDLETAKAAGMTEGIRDLERRARELGERQREMQSAVEGLPGAAGADRAERIRRLDERKDAMATEVDRMQADAERLARDARREQPTASAGLDGAASEIRDSRLRDRIAYSKGVIRSGSPEYAREFEGQIGEYLNSVAERFREAAGAVGESAERRQERSLERARDLVRGLESLRERTGQRTGQAGQQGAQGAEQEGRQPGQQGEQGSQGQQGKQGQGQQGQQAQGQQGKQGQGQQGQQGQGQQGQGQGQGEGQRADGNRMGGAPDGTPRSLSGGDARQFGREFRLRREAAEELRRDLQEQGVEAGELGRLIEALRRLENGRPFGDPKGLDELQAALIERLKTFEFTLWRQFNAGAADRPALGAAGQVPPEYRALVEEYYRSLARQR